MILERVSLAMNPRGQLYRKQPLYQIVRESGNGPAVEEFEKRTGSCLWAVYRVRRLYKGKGKADRCVEKLDEYASEVSAVEAVRVLSETRSLKLRSHHGLTYAYAKERGPSYPATEEYYVASPAQVATKARHGVAWFEAKWANLGDLYCGTDDLPLFSAAESQEP